MKYICSYCGSMIFEYQLRLDSNAVGMPLMDLICGSIKAKGYLKLASSGRFETGVYSLREQIKRESNAF